jgi:predicted  nucleic acid-binding Zn-ribbon protein
MHVQLELLLEIQDLRSQRAGLRDDALAEMEAGYFEIEIGDAIELLESKLAELESRLDPEVRSRYDTITEHGLRAVVPVLSGICYGCFVAVPTAWASEAARNARLDVCENCGRFLYHVE